MGEDEAPEKDDSKDASWYVLGALGTLFFVTTYALIAYGLTQPLYYSSLFSFSQSGLRESPTCLAVFIPVIAFMIAMVYVNKHFELVFYAYQAFFTLVILYILSSFTMTDGGMDVGFFWIFLGFVSLEVASIVWHTQKKWRREQEEDRSFGFWKGVLCYVAFLLLFPALASGTITVIAIIITILSFMGLGGWVPF